MLIEARGIRLSLPDRGRPGSLFRPAPQVEILKGIDFHVAAGEAVGIVGESGSGKTTLGRVLIRLMRPTSGTLTFAGRDIASCGEDALRPLRPRMQMIFQNPLSSLNPRRRVRDIVAAPLVAAGVPDDGTRVMAALARAGLGREFAGRYPHQLSGGQRQRVGIARAIVTEPAFILADEIVSGLDVSTQAQILTLLRDLAREMSLALAFIAHDLSVVRVLCDRVAVMLQGRIVEDGPCGEIFENPKHPYTRRLIRAIPLPEIDDGWLDNPEAMEEA